MIRKLNTPFLRFLAVAAAVIPLTFACSSQQQQGDELEVSQENSQEDFGNDDAGDGNGQENIVNEEGLNNAENSDSQDSADMNNDTLNDTQEGNLVDDEELSEDSSQMNEEGINEEDALAEEMPLEENSAMPAEMHAEEMPAEEMQAEEAAPVAAGGSSPIPGGRVRYVTEGGAQVTSGPNGAPVYSLNQGDHPVTWDEGGVYKVSEGMYVSPEQLSDRPVGRSHAPAMWQ